MKFESFVAARYLRPPGGGHRFTRFITGVAIGGVTLGVAALLLALSIVRGFSDEIQSKIVGFGAHVQVESLRDAPIDDAERIAAQLSEIAGVEQVAPVVTEFALLRRGAREIDGVALWGTDAPPPFLADRVTGGRFDYAPDESGRPGMVVGATLARSLGFAVGDVVTAFSMRQSGAQPTGFARPRVKQFYVAGIYETSLVGFDEVYAFVAIAQARSLLAYGADEVTRFDLTLADPDDAEATARLIDELLGFPLMARTIFEVFRSLFAWVNLQESIIPLIIGVIVLVAAFNIVGTLLMIILEKTRDIGVLLGMGASSRAMRRLFLRLGLTIGLAGVVAGEALALGLALAQMRWGLIPLPEEAYYMKTAPVALEALDFLVVAVIAIALCGLAAYLPARFASRIDPLRAIRFR